ncbi:MAG: alkaline phosphatase family protein [Alphaproteobacteria bacterium]|nr:alkaline phosphatase family protein [Alphaproteobacteria bacterium]
MNSFLLVVFDGLRPDMVRPDTTPNLMRFARLGTRFARARSVFPSETRVCSASIATGCLPRRHGLVANRIAHPRDPRRSVDTGQMEVLMALEQETGAPLLEAPTLARLLADAGREFCLFSSGTTGQTFVLNPEAAALGQITLSAHGAAFCSPAGARLLARLDPPPAQAAARAVWLADAWRTHMLPAPPAASILWLCEPDFSGHYDGLGSPGQLAALRDADAAFGRLIDAWQAGPQRDTLTIAVASDHGHATITGLHAVAPDMAGSPAAGATLMAGSSCGFAVPDPTPERIAAIAAWLTRQDWAGSVFAADGIDMPDGVLPRSVLLADHARAAPVLFTLRASDALAPSGLTGDGLAGVTLYDGGLKPGGGTHGGLLAAEMHTVLMLAGAPIRAGVASEVPAGLCDIAPTVLALLGLPGGAAMDGRVLEEAMHPPPASLPSPAPETWEAAAPGYRQRVGRTRLGRHLYIDSGQRD